MRLVYSCFDIVLIALFCAAIRRDSVSLFKFPFLCHIPGSSFKSLPVCRLKCSYCCFSYHFCFLVIFHLSILVSSVLFPVAVTCLPPPFLCILLVDVSTLSAILVSPLPPYFLVTYNLSMSSLGCKAIWIVMSIFVLWSISANYFLVHFRDGPENLTREGVSNIFLDLLRYPFLKFFFHVHLFGGICFQYYQVWASFLFTECNVLSLIW